MPQAGTFGRGQATAFALASVTAFMMNLYASDVSGCPESLTACAAASAECKAVSASVWLVRCLLYLSLVLFISSESGARVWLLEGVVAGEAFGVFLAPSLGLDFLDVEDAEAFGVFSASSFGVDFLDDEAFACLDAGSSNSAASAASSSWLSS
jgi:hypothetical protein